MTVDTRTARRRELAFADWPAVVSDLDAIERGLNAGTLATSGNWSVGQIGEHCAVLVDGALDGFEFRAPWPMRKLARALFFRQFVSPIRPFPSGIRIPRALRPAVPAPEVDDRAGLAHLRRGVERIAAGERMTQPSPLVERLTPEQWDVVQRKHLALHLSFVHPDG